METTLDITAKLAALADPTRLAVFEMIADTPSAVGELARRLPVSRPAVSQHLKVLTDARLARVREDGARRIYSVEPAGLAEMRRWIETYWETVLDRFEDAALREPGRGDTERRDVKSPQSAGEETEG